MKRKPTIGFALSGSGNRTTFYIGFLEVLEENGIMPDFITTCSGGSIVAAAFACGTLQKLKNFVLNAKKDALKKFIQRAKEGGLYSLDLFEDEFRKYTLNKTFEQVSPKMTFVAVDIENGDKIHLSMGDLAKAVRISCTVPGLFAPVKWGNKTLVDGGLLSLIPLDALKKWPVDITVGINMRTTEHLFPRGQINLKKLYNGLKKMLFFKELELVLKSLLRIDSNSGIEDVSVKSRGLFSVWGKSLDLAIEANRHSKNEDLNCDLMIQPDLLPINNIEITSETMNYFYHYGRETATKYVPQMERLLKERMEKHNREIEAKPPQLAHSTV